MQHSIYIKKHGVRLVISSLAITFLIIGIVSNGNASSQTTALSPCADGVGILINGSATSTVIIPPDSIPVISLHTTSSNSGQISKVLFYLNDQKPLGRAMAENTYTWTMPWVTGLSGLPSGSVAKLNARIFYTDSTSGASSVCVTTQNVNATIQTTHAVALGVTVSPLGWVGPMSSSFPVSTSATVAEPSFDPTPYAIYEWSTNIGYLTPMGKLAQFSSGARIGNGEVKVKIMYGGAVRELNIPINVKAPDTPLPTTNDASSTTGANDNTVTTNTDTTPSTTPASTIQNPTAQDCVITAIGKERFTLINTGKVRPTPDEIQNFKLCFATNNYVVPSNFAPIAPTTIKDLTLVKTIQITTLNNEKRVNDMTEKNVLRIGGKAAPNSTVFIYIFSDPLVLTTTTDGDGNWEYILEDPIEPGNHEIYSVVNRGDGIYERSEAVAFKMDATAEAVTINPNGLTLKLASATPAQTQRSLGLYITGSVTVLAFAVSAFILTLFKRNRVPINNTTFGKHLAKSFTGSEVQTRSALGLKRPSTTQDNDASITHNDKPSEHPPTQIQVDDTKSPELEDNSTDGKLMDDN